MRPQQTAKRKRGFESAVRGAMGRALIRTNKELGQAVGMTETQMSYRMSGKTKWSIEEVWALDSVLHFTDEEKLMLIGEDGGGMSWFAWTLAFIGAAWLSWAIVKGVEALGR